MSQKAVFELLRELGGKASTTQIRKLARSKYPEASLYTYVADRLHKLAGSGYVRQNADRTWEIISKVGPAT